MESEAGRAPGERILALLEEAEEPITGSTLSSLFGVTRQVIVGDVAVLRAQGAGIIATPQGYLLPKAAARGAHRSRVAVRHGAENAELARELNLIVDLGGTVVDVSVEHPLYGELTANLQLSSRQDVQRFIEKMQELQGEPLLVLTGGLSSAYNRCPQPGSDGRNPGRIAPGRVSGGIAVQARKYRSL